MSIEGQVHFFTIYFPGFVCFVLYKAEITGERLQDHWSSGYFLFYQVFSQVRVRGRNKNKINSDHFPIELKSKETRNCVYFDLNSIGKWPK